MRDAQGRFLPGYDPGRHRLTRTERRRGYRTLMSGGRNGKLGAAVLAWAWRKVRKHYRQRED